MVLFPTRLNNTLDIIATNRPTFVNNCIPHPGLSDHQTAVMLNIVSHPRRSKPVKRKVSLWKRADINTIRNHVDIQITNFVTNNNINTPVDELWCKFKDLVASSMSFVPSKTTSTRYSQPWITPKCKRLSRRKKRAYNRAKRTNHAEDWHKFKVLTIKSRKACKAAYNNYVVKCVNQGDNSNHKKLFSFIKSRKCENNGVAPLRDKGQIHISDKAKANILNDQFSSVFSKPDGRTPPLIGQRSTSMPEININVAGVKKLLKELNPNKASGPDGISSRFLKETGNELAPGLTLIMQASINQSTTPNDWRNALIAPVFKSGKPDKAKAENYRPISLTSISCKILEHIIHSTIISHLDKNKILTDTQHGFRKHRSCESQLLLTIHDLAKSLNEGGQIDSVLLDFSKAFDKVDHRKLCLKLDHYRELF